MNSGKTRQKRKQVKMRAQAPLHLRQKHMHSRLSKELRKKLATGRRAVQVRKGDKVKLLCGDEKGKAGKVTEVDLKLAKIYVEGVFVKKAKGNEVPMPVDPSNVEILDGDFSADRQKILGRSAKAA